VDNRREKFKELVNESGWGLFPLHGKRAFQNGWQKWCEEKRPFNPADFEGHNAGIPTGPANGIIVLDVDHVEKFNKMREANGWELPQTRMHMTGRGKPHYVYRYPQNGKQYGCRSVKDPEGERDPETGKVITIFDVKGLGGYVVAPGSIHPDTGRPYEVRHPGPIAPAPQWLLDLASGETSKEQPKATNTTAGVNLDSLPLILPVKELIRRGAPKGARSESIFSVIQHLLKARLPYATIVSIFERYPIGEKYREKGNAKERWLQGEIKRAREKGTVKQDALEFPSHVMAGAAGQFAECYASYLEAPAHFFYFGYLTCLGSVLADRVTLASEITPQPRLYTLILGESASDRKSTAIAKTTSFFKETIESFATCFGVGSAEGLQKRLEDSSKLLLVFDEFRAFVGKAKIENSVLLPCVTTLFEANRYEAITKKSHISLEGVYLSLLAASTVETYERTWDSSFTAIGFNNRLFLVPGSGEKRHAWPVKVPESEKRELRHNLRRVLAHTGNGLELGITPAAKELYETWYFTLDNSVHTKRLDTYAMRLMALLAVNSLENRITEKVVTGVLDIMNWQRAIRQKHDPIDADGKVAKMEERIRRTLNLKGTLSSRKLKQLVHAHRTGLWVYEAALKNLQIAREIQWNKEAKGWEPYEV